MSLVAKTVGVIGSREFKNWTLFNTILNSNIGPEDVLVSGGAVGADSLAQRWAKENGHSIIIHYPNYKAFGKGATFARNKLIARDCEILIAFYTRDRFQQGGTRHTVEEAYKLDKWVIEVIDDG